MKKNNLKNLRGFTVLELLIVIAMMVLLMGMVLMGLNSSRSHARDQARISDIKKIQIGITRFYQACGHYPTELIHDASCFGPGASEELINFIPDIASFNIYGAGSRYKYTPLSYKTGSSPQDCTGYHIGVILENSNNALATKDSQFNSLALPSGIHLCTTSTSGFNGSVTGTYDVMVNY